MFGRITWMLGRIRIYLNENVFFVYLRNYSDNALAMVKMKKGVGLWSSHHFPSNDKLVYTHKCYTQNLSHFCMSEKGFFLIAQRVSNSLKLNIYTNDCLITQLWIEFMFNIRDSIENCRYKIKVSRYHVQFLTTNKLDSSTNNQSTDSPGAYPASVCI